ncbi:MAG: esterase [Undibacterium sp.]|nr:esterase [Opitutaceae bacterium]
MRSLFRLILLACALCTGLSLPAAEALTRRTWTVEGVTREALVALPPDATTKPTPVLFVFHGHGGTMGHAARTMAFHTLWPEALIVYPEGLNTPGTLTDPEGKKSGWQSAAGDQGDRDLKFFDALLASLRREFHIDDRRLYATGHSNGGGFTYLLWAGRGAQFAPFAPSSPIAARAVPKLKPKPVWHLAGRNDDLVKFAWQGRMIEAVRRINQCGPAQPAVNGQVTYPSKVGAPVVTYIHAGGHTFPAEAPALIVAFFKTHALPALPAPPAPAP